MQLNLALTKNTLYLFSARAVNTITLLAIVMIVSRKFGPEIFGEFSFLQAVVMTSIIAAGFGLDLLMVREVSRDHEKGNEYLVSVIAFKIAASVIIIAVICAGFAFSGISTKLYWLLSIYSIVILLNSVSVTFWHYADAFQRFDIHAFLWALSNVLKLILVIGFVFLGTGLISIILALIIAEMLSLLMSGVVVKRGFNLVFPKFSFKLAIPLAKIAWPMAVISFLGVLHYRVGVILLKILSDEMELGLFAAAIKLIEFITIIPGTICMVVYPGLSSGFVNNLAEFKSDLKNSLISFAFLGLICGILLYAFSGLIIQYLYGVEFNASIKALEVISFSVVAVFLNVVLSYALMASNMELKASVVLFAAIVFNFAINIYLIPRYGYIGASYSILMAEAFRMILLFVILLAAPGSIFNKATILETHE